MNEVVRLLGLTGRWLLGGRQRAMEHEDAPEASVWGALGYALGGVGLVPGLEVARDRRVHAREPTADPPPQGGKRQPRQAH